jgi:ubiquitin C-terminal hydrolase
MDDRRDMRTISSLTTSTQNTSTIIFLILLRNIERNLNFNQRLVLIALCYVSMSFFGFGPIIPSHRHSELEELDYIVIMGKKNKDKKKRGDPDAEHSNQRQDPASDNPSDAEDNHGNDNSSLNFKRCKHIKKVPENKVQLWLKKIYEAKDQLLSSQDSIKKSRKKSKPAENPQLCCLICGIITVGASASADSALQHFISNSTHYIALNLTDFTLRCLPCDIIFTPESVEGDKKIKKTVEIITEIVKSYTNKHNKAGKKKNNNENRLESSDSETELDKTPTNSIEIACGEEKSINIPVKGLKNVGNTCYFNSVMQNLASTVPLISYFRSISNPGSTLPLFSHLHSFFASVLTDNNSNKTSVINPSPLLNEICRFSPQFKGGRQQDSHELLRALLSGLLEESEKEGKNRKIAELHAAIKNWGPKEVESALNGLEVADNAELEQLRRNFADFNGEKLLRLAENWLGKQGKKQRAVLFAGISSLQAKQRFTALIGKIKNGVWPNLAEKIAESNDDRSNRSSGGSGTSKGGGNFVHNIFGGVLQNTVECLACHSISITTEQFYDLSLPIQPPRNHSAGAERREMAVFPSSYHRSKHQQSNSGSRINRLSKAQRKLKNKKKGKPSHEMQHNSGENSGEENEGNPEKSEEEGEEKEKEAKEGTEESKESKENGEIKEKDSQEAAVTQNGVSEGDITEKLAQLNLGEQQNTDSATNATKNSAINAEFVTNGDENNESKQEGDISASKSNEELQDEQGRLTMKKSNSPQASVSSLLELLRQSNIQSGRGNKLGFERLAGACTVEDCLFAFTDPDLLTGANKYGCSHCTQKQLEQVKLSSPSKAAQSKVFDDSGEEAAPSSEGEEELLLEEQPVPKLATVKNDAKKQLLIKTPPPVLTLHLKRFQQSSSGRTFEKCDKVVRYPEVLNLAPFMVSVPNPCYYRLYGIATHLGGIGGGHYIAYSRKGNNHWYNISDQSYDVVNLQTVLASAQAYLLFYEKVEV